MSHRIPSDLIEGSPYSWEIMEESLANFTCDFTPPYTGNSLVSHRFSNDLIEGSPYSWEIMEESLATFTCDFTPLILATHW